MSSILEENPACACGAVCCPLVCILVGILTSLRTVPAGHLGLRTTFGSPSPDLLTPGLHITNPFAGVEQFSVKTTRFSQRNTVPTREGLLVGLDVALLFHVQPDKIFEIFTTLGDYFVDVLIGPL